MNLDARQSNKTEKRNAFKTQLAATNNQKQADEKDKQIRRQMASSQNKEIGKERNAKKLMQKYRERQLFGGLKPKRRKDTNEWLLKPTV